MLNDGDWILSENMDPNGNVKLIQLGSIGLMRYIDKGFKYLTEDTFHKLSCTQIFPGYMLINRIISDKMYACILPQLEGKLITTVDTCWIAPKDEWYNLKYLMYFISSTVFQSIVLHVSSGTTRKRISKSDLIHLPIYLPPLSEQQRMVSRVDELFEQIDIIEKNQADIDALYDEFRKRTLTLAIQGKLVPQDPNDEPASVLIERIRAEKKAKLGKKYVDSYIYKGDDNCYYEKVGETVTNISDEMPFDLPENWEWIRLGYVIDFSKSDTITASQIDPSSWVLDLEDIEKDSGRVLQKKAMRETQSKSDKHSFYKGNVLYSKLRPYLNKVIVADDDGYCTTEILAFDFGQHIVAQYAQIYLMSPYFVDYAMAGAYGVKMPRIGSTRGNSALMPIPPFNEQVRIVDRYNTICKLLKDED